MSCTYDKSTDHAQLVRLLRRLEALGPGTYRPITHTPVAHTPVAKPADARTADARTGWTWSGGSRFDKEWYRLVAQQCRKLKATSDSATFKYQQDDFREMLKVFAQRLHEAYLDRDDKATRVNSVLGLWKSLEPRLELFELRECRTPEQKSSVDYIVAEMAKYTNHFKR